ncbi:adaptin ear-binding coat-associated protein 1 [Willisornis vidua]|uniref:Adaptin ear-binding coat-associated protein 1 n=1 Tax=Willisornis vidua TaxID=1566151 RepID=A0ABQ9DFR5_9PASS|nr:adaptin ear-binding coat-associated protein 1 [Willisornis vidua]
MTGVPCWMVTGSSGGIGRAEEADGVALCVTEELECMEFIVDNGTVVSLWVRIKGLTNNANIIVGVYHRPSSQDDDADKLFFEELRDTPKSIALVLMRNFNLTEINWERHTAGTTQTIRLLKNLNNFMEQVLREPSQKDAIVDLHLVNRVDLVREAEIGGCLGHSKHEVIEFRISNDRRKSDSRTSTLDMRRTDFRLFGELVQSAQGQNKNRDRPLFIVKHPMEDNLNPVGKGAEEKSSEDHIFWNVKVEGRSPKDEANLRDSYVRIKQSEPYDTLKLESPDPKDQTSSRERMEEGIEESKFKI